MNITITTFNGGYATPLLANRNDISKYESLCRKLDNMFPRIYGCVEKRPGTRFIFDATTPWSGGGWPAS
jgi:hypothetical protein